MKSKRRSSAAPPTAEIAGELAALKRARRRAEGIAAATGTALVVVRDGRIVRIRPKPTVADSTWAGERAGAGRRAGSFVMDPAVAIRVAAPCLWLHLVADLGRTRLLGLLSRIHHLRDLALDLPT